MKSCFREVTEQHPHQLQQLPHQLDVDLHNGLLINGAMMKTTMLIAIGMVALAVTTILEVGTHTAQPVNALNHQLQPLPLQPPPLLQLLRQRQLPRQLQPLQQLQPQLQVQQLNLLHLESVVRSKKSQNFAILESSILRYVNYLQLICHPS